MQKWNTKQNKTRFSLYEQKSIAYIVQERKRKYEENKKNREKQSNME